MWDKLSGKPVYRAIVWQDRRTITMCEKLINKKLASKIQKITGLVIDPYFSATKIKWLLKNVKKTKKLLKDNRLLFGTIDTWLLWNLTEKKSHFTDITNASRTMLYDSNKEEWSKSLLKLLEIPHKILPEVKPNVFDFGYTKIFGSPINIGGMAGDQQASAIGHTCFTLGKAKSTYGTGCFLLMNIGNKFKISKNKLLTSVAYKIGNKKMYCYEGSIFVAGSSIQWLRDKLLMFKDSKDTDKLYANSNKDENVISITALTGLGAPHWQPQVRGAFFGLTRNTSRNEIVKSIDENVLYQYRRYYIRENKNNVCPTLTANMGGGGHNVPLLKDSKGIRKLTPRECFNLQGFPSTYQLPNISDGSLYKLAGNAVSVPVVELIAQKINKLLNPPIPEWLRIRKLYDNIWN